MNTLELIDLIQSGKTTDMEATFEDIVSEKMQDALEIRKMEISQTMFVESETLDELSGATLGSYAQKANVDLKARRKHANELDADPKVVKLTNKIHGYYDSNHYKKDGRSVHAKAMGTIIQKIEDIKKKNDPNYPKSTYTLKRNKGIERVVDRMKYGTKMSEDVNTD